ncbi:MAG: high frequency lysogenization protein HflD [Gammaproteobacteria bacterium]|jgi:high frequency lysogenization protein
MDTKTRNITIALAGVFQAAYLVKEWAHKGQMDEDAFLTCINSLLDLNPADMNTIYGEPAHLKLGLKTMVDFFKQASENRDKEIASYFVSLIILQRKLRKHPEMMQKIHDRIPFVTTQIKHFGIQHPTVTANIADIYSSTLSQLKYRIHVQGNRAYLESETGINKVRALLLAGVRAALLWHQVGGRLYQLFLFRKRFVLAAQTLLNTNETPHD